MIPAMWPGVVAFMLISATDTASSITYISHLTVSGHLGLSSWKGTRLPRIKAVSSAERARVFKVSSSFQRAMRTLLSIAVVIARAACEPKPQPPFSHGQCPGSRCRDIFQTGCLLAQGGRGCPLGLSRRATCHQGEPPARVEFRGEP